MNRGDHENNGKTRNKIAVSTQLSIFTYQWTKDSNKKT